MKTSSNQLRISVLVNNYNYAPYLAAALDSAIAQLQPGDEIIVVDDGSTDESVTIAQRYKARHGVTLISQENGGQLSAVRTGVLAARGEVVVLLDSDDLLLTNYLNRLRQIYTENPELTFVFSAPEVFGSTGKNMAGISKTIKNMAFPGGRVGPTKWGAILFNEFVSTPTSGISMRKSLAEKIVSIPVHPDKTEIITPAMRRIFGISEREALHHNIAADAIMVRCASALGVDKYYNDQPGFRYRIHGNNKWASIPKISRWYLRHARSRQIRQTYQTTFGISLHPKTAELHYEICNRSWSIYFPRQVRKRAEYFVATFLSKGSFKEKLITAAAAVGIH